MAPSPIVIPRQTHKPNNAPPAAGKGENREWAPVLLAVSLVVLLSATLDWAWRWTLSGAAIETLLLIYGSSVETRIFPQVPLWPLLASINLVYAICSTSWLLYFVFAVACYGTIVLTCLFQFATVSDFARRWLRKLLVELHFTKDTIAFFGLPALEIDTDVHGLFVVRGLSISLSSLTIVAYGLELGLKLSDDMELAIYADRVDIQFFRRITVGDVYGNLKGGKSEMTFGDLENADSDDSDSVFQVDTPFLRAASVSGESKRSKRPSLSNSFTGGSAMRDSSVRETIKTLQAVSADDEEAEKKYSEILQQIEETSHVYTARKEIESAEDDKNAPKTENDMRSAICAKLQEMPSVPHPPSRSIKVTTLQQISPPHVREFLHRLPFLLRLLLMPLSYFHPLNFNSISFAASGRWLSSFLQEAVFKHYGTGDAQIRRLEFRVMAWLTFANFCLQLTDVSGLGQVNLSSAYDIVTYLRFANIAAYRTSETGFINEVLRLGGADATFTIPSYLLPHHEHLLPPKPTTSDLDAQSEAVEGSDAPIEAIKAERELDKLKKDESEVNISVHASLPVWLDQRLLNFVAALVKATKIIEVEKDLDESDATDTVDRSLSTTPTLDSSSTRSSPAPSLAPRTAGIKGFAKKLGEGRTAQSIKDLAQELHQTTKEGMRDVGQSARETFRKAPSTVLAGIVNDRWIAKIVGRIAAQLEKAQGDVGYSGEIPVDLSLYRGPPDLKSKILP